MKKCKSDNYGNADDADLADLRGFAFAFGKGFFSHKFHKFSQIKPTNEVRENL
jgi:hypothetical protein